MSTKAKGINTDKIFAMLEKADLDDRVKFYHELKAHLNKQLDERADELEEKREKLLSTKEEINKNGK